jgi:hypothetical protein
MKDWHSEEEIKAQLRELTQATRKLRSELHTLIRPSKPLSPRAFVDDRGGAKPNRPTGDDNPLPRRRRK